MTSDTTYRSAAMEEIWKNSLVVGAWRELRPYMEKHNLVLNPMSVQIPIGSDGIFVLPKGTKMVPMVKMHFLGVEYANAALKQGMHTHFTHAKFGPRPVTQCWGIVEVARLAVVKAGPGFDARVGSDK